MIICIGFLLAHVRSRDGAQDQENAPMSPDPFPRERLGSGNETSQAVKLGIGGSLSRRSMGVVNARGSRPDFRCGQGVKHENLLGQDLDRGRGWKYRRLCRVPPPPPPLESSRTLLGFN